MSSNDLVTIVLGTRPEAIKLAPLIIIFRKCKNLRLRVIFTGQHKELVKQVMEIFNINYDFNLNLMREKQSLSYITKSIIGSLEEEFKEYRPKLVIVQGDTSTAFAASLAAFYQKIPVAHVEAGLRTNELFNPFPEEINRRLISQISSLHFAPTNAAKENLLNSCVTGKIYVTGNTVIDSLLMVASKKRKLLTIKINWSTNDVIFATVHRRENWGENIIKISNAFLKIIDEMPQTALLMPLHPNPKVRNPIIEILKDHPRIELIDPLNYQDSISCMKESKLILTDSGGIQEEAPSLSKPVLVLRKTTERIEAIKSGAAKLIGTETQNIFDQTIKILNNENLYSKMAKVTNPYGDGKSSEKILEACLEFLNK